MDTENKILSDGAQIRDINEGGGDTLRNMIANLVVYVKERLEDEMRTEIEPEFVANEIYLRENEDGSTEQETEPFPVFEDGALIPDLDTKGRAVLRCMIENLVHGVARTLELQTYLCNQLFGNETDKLTVDHASHARDQVPLVVIGGPAATRWMISNTQVSMVTNSYCFLQNAGDDRYKIIINLNGNTHETQRRGLSKIKFRQPENVNDNTKSVEKKDKKSKSFKDDRSVCRKGGHSLTIKGSKSHKTKNGTTIGTKGDNSVDIKDDNSTKTKTDKKLTKTSRVRRWFLGLFSCISKHKK